MALIAGIFEGIGILSETVATISEAVGAGVEGASGSEFLGAQASKAVQGSIQASAIGTVGETASNAIGSENISQTRNTFDLLMAYNDQSGNIRDIDITRYLKPKKTTKNEPVSEDKSHIGIKKPYQSVDSINRYTESIITEGLDEKPSLDKILGFTFGTNEEVNPDKQETENKIKAHANITGKMIVDNSIRETKGSSPQQSFVDSLNDYPVFQSIGQSLLNFQNNTKEYIPTDELFNSYYSVYNASNFGPNSVSIENGIISAVDEMGKTYSWDIAKDGPSNPVPTLWGHFTGISSINNKEPSVWLSINYPVNTRVYETTGSKKRVFSLLDLISFFHDCDYRDLGMFSLEADYKYISRIVHCLNANRFFTLEKQYAYVALRYFSQIGHKISAYKYSSTNQTSLAESVVEEHSDANTFIEEKESYVEMYNKELEDSVIESVSSSLIANSFNANDIVLNNLIENLEVYI